jgi:hypothetical protein
MLVAFALKNTIRLYREDLCEDLCRPGRAGA